MQNANSSLEETLVDERLRFCRRWEKALNCIHVLRWITKMPSISSHFILFGTTLIVEDILSVLEDTCVEFDLPSRNRLASLKDFVEGRYFSLRAMAVAKVEYNDDKLDDERDDEESEDEFRSEQYCRHVRARVMKIVSSISTEDVFSEVKEYSDIFRESSMERVRLSLARLEVGYH
jgi:hypothetical protein